MNRLILEIEQLDEKNIESVPDAVIARYTLLFPDWELQTLFIDRRCDRNQQIDSAIRLMQALKNLS